ncbi:MAG: YfiR family protein [Alphaproteobacteria bacterium]
MAVLRASTRFGFISCCVAFALLLAAPARAEESEAVKLQENKIKAGLIYNFLKYTNWSSSAGNNLRVCLLGGDSFSGDLDPLRGRTAQQYVIDIAYQSDIAETGACNLIFINRNQEKNLPELLRTLQGRNILTVSDIDRFTERGGMIELSKGDDRRIHLYVNRQAMAAAGISIEDRLVKLAELVRQP